MGTSAALDDLDVFPSCQGTDAGTNHAVIRNFDVFLSHRGPEKSFVLHLDAALRRAGYCPFLDARLEGNHADPMIDQALDMAKVDIAIMLRRYAESEYGLNALVAMLSSGKAVIPVFYDGEPIDLRWVENGPFAEDFERGRTQRKLHVQANALRSLYRDYWVSWLITDGEFLNKF